MKSSSVVLKFGGAAVASVEKIQEVAQIIKYKKQQYEHVIAVVSAMGDTTDNLIQMAKSIHQTPPQREMDMLISVGERISIALLSMALDAISIPAISYTGSQCGIITSNDHSSAKIIEVRPKRLYQCLNQKNVAVVAGFQGMSLAGDITTLGRGGSDTTAVALAVAINCPLVEYFKDVNGIYNKDPFENQDAKLYKELTYEEALKIVRNNSHQILQERSILLAAKNGITLAVKPFHDLEAKGTIITPELNHKVKSFPEYEKC